MTIYRSPRVLATAVLASLSLLLTGCFITPGKFTSELVLTKSVRTTGGKPAGADYPIAQNVKGVPRRGKE